MEIENKIDRLKEFLKDKKCILAFSAGSDSTLLAYIVSQVSPNSILATIDNNMMPKEFIKYTQEKAKEFNLKHEIIKLDFLKDPEFLSNNPKRCYNCRKLMYSNIQKLPEFNEYDYFLEGTNLTDLLEDRPGVLVSSMYNMTSPLIECEITKKDVFEMINYFKLEYSNDTTCLATRVKTNEAVDEEKLNMVYEAEKFVKTYVHQENIRVRFDKYNATLSVDEPLEILDKNLIKTLRDKLQELGFKKIFLDITGYTKTELKFSIENNDTYYYQLPYTIDLNNTFNAIQKNPNLTKKTQQFPKYIQYNDITIHENGKISMPQTDEFINKFNNVLPAIKRKKVE
ncbi:ATP-dependent sacrificial sulfur transferase LarE [Methanosphaera sp.]